MTAWPIRSAVAMLVITALTAGLAAQDPLVVSPDAYRLEFENAWVKVTRVVYAPKAVIAPHFHTPRASAYVYLSDGGPIVFKHEGLPYAGVTRPATRAGSFRVYKGLEEVHSVENPTDVPSEFLRVEFKTVPLDEASLRGKFFRDDPPATATGSRVQFENAHVRISRVHVAAGGTIDLTTESMPALVVALARASLADGGTAHRELGIGQTGWLDAGTAAVVRAGVAAWTEVLRFDWKTGPVDTR
ncbi:MAG: hypothetical protein AB7U83_15825 [Vicinamibacterales bacterium]